MYVLMDVFVSNAGSVVVVPKLEFEKLEVNKRKIMSSVIDFFIKFPFLTFFSVYRIHSILTNLNMFTGSENDIINSDKED